MIVRILPIGTFTALDYIGRTTLILLTASHTNRKVNLGIKNVKDDEAEWRRRKRKRRRRRKTV